MSGEESNSLLDELGEILEKQIEAARKTDFRRVEALAGQAGIVIEKIVRVNHLCNTQFERRRGYLAELYKKLELTLATGKDSISSQLCQIANVRKTLGAYRSKS